MTLAKKEIKNAINFAFSSAVPIGYTSIYGELPKIESNKGTDWDIPFVPSERPWETIFSGSSHVLPPLTKLCSTFLASLLEKRPPIADES